MKKVITTEKIPIKLWLDNLEEGALKQAKNLANLPFAFKHIPIMPDSHLGYGMPIGSILATKGVVVPNAVGVDIGCGMCAVQTNLTDISKDQLREVLKEAKRRIPVGFNQHKKAKPLDAKLSYHLGIIGNNYEKASKQLGTLGGGNHFIEIQKGSDGFIWIMIHSGSRNLGFTVANHYNKLAVKANEENYSMVGKEQQLAFLPLDSIDAENYLLEMDYCIDYALKNRREMMTQMMESLISAIPYSDIIEKQFINESHNFAAIENHFGENVLVHRKGATRAYSGELGMIPGSQGTKSYIVRGKGEEQSFKSCSHGAGRKLGRKQAQRELNLDEEISAMNKLGILHNIKSEKQLDEAAGAYKDIDVVMDNQSDLIDIVVELTPLGVIKG